MSCPCNGLFFQFFFYLFVNLNQCEIIDENKDQHLVINFRETFFAFGSGALILPYTVGWQCVTKESDFIFATSYATLPSNVTRHSILRKEG